MRRFSVRQLTEELQTLLRARYPSIEVEGEVSGLTVPGSGHAYLTLRDGDANLGAVAWRDTWRHLPYRPKRGDQVVCRGRLGVYGGKGAYQLYVHDIQPAGAGALAAEIAARRARLEADGLLDPRRKRSLPAFPKVVGVATSLTGAALQDFLKVSGERFPAARILVVGCTVQGERAPGEIVQAVELLLDDGRAEVIVVTRGGGSKEDLLAFQDEGLARYLAHCPVPVVSAVGHQIDTTLSDLVADAVAATPTDAAVRVLPDGPSLVQRVDDATMALEGAFLRGVRARRERTEALRSRLRHPAARLADVRRRAAELEARAAAVVTRQVRASRRDLDELDDRLRVATARAIQRARARHAALVPALPAAAERRLQRARARLEAVDGRAEALSPLRVLERGYAVVTGPDGVVRSPADVAEGQALTVRVQGGEFGAVVTRTGQD